MLGPGDRVPDALVWPHPIEGPVQLREAIEGDGLVFLFFYLWDWSPT